MQDSEQSASGLQDFEKLIEESKDIIEKLGDIHLSLQDSLELYKSGAQKLKLAQDILEKSKLEFIKFNQDMNEKGE